MATPHAHAHAHVIMPMRTLVTVLALLMLFTGLTVLAANIEVLFASVFELKIPQYVNVLVALSIAAVKSIIVAAYFMQLRHDNPLNTMIAAFTILVLTFFLGFTMIDLGTRDTLYKYKAEQIIPGGVGGVTLAGGAQVPTNVSIAQFARQQADKKIEQLLSEGKPLNKTLGKRLANLVEDLHAAGKPVPASYAAYLAANPALAEAAHGHGHTDKHGDDYGHAAESSPDVSRVRTGITLPELMPAGAAPGHDSTKPGDDAHRSN
jgi:cytochrome c oxidase subunit 4